MTSTGPSLASSRHGDDRGDLVGGLARAVDDLGQPLAALPVRGRRRRSRGRRCPAASITGTAARRWRAGRSCCPLRKPSRSREQNAKPAPWTRGGHLAAAVERRGPGRPRAPRRGPRCRRRAAGRGAPPKPERVQGVLGDLDAAQHVRGDRVAVGHPRRQARGRGLVRRDEAEQRADRADVGLGQPGVDQRRRWRRAARPPPARAGGRRGRRGWCRARRRAPHSAASGSSASKSADLQWKHRSPPLRAYSGRSELVGAHLDVRRCRARAAKSAAPRALGGGQARRHGGDGHRGAPEHLAATAASSAESTPPENATSSRRAARTVARSAESEGSEVRGSATRPLVGAGRWAVRTPEPGAGQPPPAESCLWRASRAITAAPATGTAASTSQGTTGGATTGSSSDPTRVLPTSTARPPAEDNTPK